MYSMTTLSYLKTPPATEGQGAIESLFVRRKVYGSTSNQLANQEAANFLHSVIVFKALSQSHYLLGPVPAAIRHNA